MTPLRRPNLLPLLVAVSGGLLTWLVQAVLRPLAPPVSLARWVLG